MTHNIFEVLGYMGVLGQERKQLINRFDLYTFEIYKDTLEHLTNIWMLLEEMDMNSVNNRTWIMDAYVHHTKEHPYNVMLSEGLNGVKAIENILGIIQTKINH